MMKRIVSTVLAFFLMLAISPAALAEWDLSSMSYDELVALKEQINLAIWNSRDWLEVEVPQGVWEVGKDIPAGKWTIRAAPNGNAYVKVGTQLKDGGTDIKASFTGDIYDPGYRQYNSSNLTEWTVELVSGQYVSIKYSNAIFTPYAGKPELGFRRGDEASDDLAQSEMSGLPESAEPVSTAQPEDVPEEHTPTLGEINALKKANSYLKFSAFSMWGLVDQLMYEGFTEEEAIYGAWNTGADWYEQAVKKARSYLSFSSFSRDGLIEQLEYEQFSHEEAVYAAEQVGF